MYVPSAFAQNDPATLHQFIGRHSFATVCTVGEDGFPFASHVPVLFDPGAGPHGTLLGHLARANPQWQHAHEKPALVIFTGPHHYVSPAWYEAENVVPTWNYAAVHVRGSFRAFHDADRLLRLLREMVSRYESGREAPWRMQEGPFVEGLLRGIVGFEIAAERIEGKWKLSQNQPAGRREKVRQALRREGNPDARAVAELMDDMTAARKEEGPR